MGGWLFSYSYREVECKERITCGQGLPVLIKGHVYGEKFTDTNNKLAIKIGGASTIIDLYYQTKQSAKGLAVGGMAVKSPW